MDIRERLDGWFKAGRPIGFSPWRDAQAVLWGYLTAVDARTFRVRLVNPYGQKEDEETYFYSAVSYFQDEPTYAERLKRLENFRPTMPDSAAYFKDRRRVREVLEEALETGEVITVHLLSESSSRDVRVVGIDKTWVEIVDYSDLMDALSIQVWRRSAILAVRWRTAHEEANNYLLPSVPNLET